MKRAGAAANMIFLWLVTQVLNVFFDFFTGAKRRPVFFDVAKTCPQLLEFDRRYPAIREELELILADRSDIPRYHDVDALQHDISAVANPEKKWQVFMLDTMGHRWAENCARCPVTSRLLDNTPDLFQAFFSILEGGKSIPAHNGIYRGYLRYHLALKVPQRNPPKIRIKDRYHVWREGEGVLFDDSWEHEVYNDADDIRVVLIVDVLRPMPPVPQAINRLAKAYLGLHYVRSMLNKQVFQ